MPMKETAVPRQHAYTGPALPQLHEPSHAERTYSHLTGVDRYAVHALPQASGFPFDSLRRRGTRRYSHESGSRITGRSEALLQFGPLSRDPVTLGEIRDLIRSEFVRSSNFFACGSKSGKLSACKRASSFWNACMRSNALEGDLSRGEPLLPRCERR